MQFLTVVALSLASLAAAAPSPHEPECSPVEYQCTHDASGWDVCDASGHWVYGGACPPHTVCKFFDPSASPYCVPADHDIQ